MVSIFYNYELPGLMTSPSHFMCVITGIGKKSIILRSISGALGLMIRDQKGCVLIVPATEEICVSPLLAVVDTIHGELLSHHADAHID